MNEIKVNNQIWDSVSDKEKEQIIDVLREHGLLEGITILADENTPPPSSETLLYAATVGDMYSMELLGLPSWACKLACDAAAASATAALMPLGLAPPVLAAALAVIAAGRKYCMSKC